MTPGLFQGPVSSLSHLTPYTPSSTRLDNQGYQTQHLDPLLFRFDKNERPNPPLTTAPDTPWSPDMPDPSGRNWWAGPGLFTPRAPIYPPRYSYPPPGYGGHAYTLLPPLILPSHHSTAHISPPQLTPPLHLHTPISSHSHHSPTRLAPVTPLKSIFETPSQDHHSLSPASPASSCDQLEEGENELDSPIKDRASPSYTPPRTGRAGVKRKMKYQRTRSGCLCCRQRRIKCDEGKPTCNRCMIAKKICEYAPGEVIISRKRKASTDVYSPRPAKIKKAPKTAQQAPVTPRRSPKLRAAKTRRRKLSDDSPVEKSQATTFNHSTPVTSTWHSSFLSLTTETTHPQRHTAPPPVEAKITPIPENELDSYAHPTWPEVEATTGMTGIEMDNEAFISEMSGLEKFGAGGGAPMLTAPDYLLPWFTTPQERELILHYAANASTLMMAIPSGLNPMLAINLPLALACPRGTNLASDALRVALLGTGAIHQAFLLSRSGVNNHQTAAMFQFASSLREKGKDMVKRSNMSEEGASSDGALGAATALASIDIFFGGNGWMDNFAMAKEMVRFRGGPAEMLKVSQPRQLAVGVTLSPARMMLEILAIYETFGCLTTGEEPTLLSGQWEEWWFECRSTYQKYSVEKQFGMSRVMVHLFARLTRLLSRVAKSNVVFQLPDTSSVSLDDPLVLEANKLNGDVEAWIENLQMTDTNMEYDRIQVGNRAYAHAMKILLLRRVFDVPREDERIKFAAKEVLQHCSVSTAMLNMPIDLVWPAIISACCLPAESRSWCLTLLEGFKAQCCFDIDTAAKIIMESWNRWDKGNKRWDWKEVCEDLGLKVLLC